MGSGAGMLVFVDWEWKEAAEPRFLRLQSDMIVSTSFAPSCILAFKSYLELSLEIAARKHRSVFIR